MKVKRQVIEQYLELCPLSSFKCSTHEEIEYKVKRCVSLGKIVEMNNDGSLVYGYYHLRFIVKDECVIEMFKVNKKYTIHIKEYLKAKYDQVNDKVVV
ncbi:hypothetical protein GCM10023310_69200 [Paenibacillus vulneris]|uniref:Uncharacterized protein n=1 Tax=Paenibacillus vulneris TaxID=1133364 RepID=A0ABW3UIN5_9BACL